ncbi:MAG: alginate export family protein [Planctomycetota bacterium]
MTAVSTATVLALSPFALAQNTNDEAQKKINDLEKLVKELQSQVNDLRDHTARTASTDDLDRAIADLANRIEAKVGMSSKGGPNVSAPDLRSLTLRFENRFRAEWYGDRTFGAKKNDPIVPSSLVTNVSPFAPNGTVFGSFIGGSGQNEMSDDAERILNRARINIDIDVNDDLAAFFQLQHSQVWGTPIGAGAAAGGSLLPNAPITDVIAPIPPTPLGEQLQATAGAGALGFKQANVTFKNVFGSKEAAVTMGRFNLELGKGRILSSAEHDNVGRAFDGVKVVWNSDEVAITAFATKVVQGGLDFQNQDTNLFGAWAKFSPVKEVSITPYTLWVDANSQGPTTPVGRPWTLGAIATIDVVDTGLTLNGEANIQQDHSRPNIVPVGTPGGLDLNKDVNWRDAYAWAVGADYALPIADADEYKPTVGIEYLNGSKMFNDLYGARHGISGISDVVTSWNNLRQWKFHAGIAPTKDIDLRASFYIMRIDEDAGEAILGQSTQSRRLGEELNLEIFTKCSEHITVSLGYAHFFNGYSLQDGAYSPGAAYATAISKSADTRQDADAIIATVSVTF